MEYLIREFEDNDIHMLVQLCERHALYEGARYDSKDKEKLLVQALASTTPPLTCWVVVIDHTVVGYLTYTVDFSTWDAKYFLHMDCLFLDEKFRGYGIGKAIINRLKKEANRLACINIQWQTPTSNVEAIRFYNKIGGLSLDKKRFFLLP